MFVEVAVVLLYVKPKLGRVRGWVAQAQRCMLQVTTWQVARQPTD